MSNNIQTPKSGQQTKEILAVVTQYEQQDLVAFIEDVLDLLPPPMIQQIHTMITNQCYPAPK